MSHRRSLEDRSGRNTFMKKPGIGSVEAHISIARKSVSSVISGISTGGPNICAVAGTGKSGA